MCYSFLALESVLHVCRRLAVVAAKETRKASPVNVAVGLSYFSRFLYGFASLYLIQSPASRP